MVLLKGKYYFSSKGINVLKNTFSYNFYYFTMQSCFKLFTFWNNRFFFNLYLKEQYFSKNFQCIKIEVNSNRSLILTITNKLISYEFTTYKYLQIQINKVVDHDYMGTHVLMCPCGTNNNKLQLYD